jgi:hypothetical protein
MDKTDIKSISKNYDLDFACCFDDSELMNHFEEFLKISHNYDQLTFYHKVDEYKHLKASKNRYQLAKKLMNNFIEEHSKQQINLSNHIRKSIQEKFLKIQENFDLEENENNDNDMEDENLKLNLNPCPSDLFDIVQNDVFLQLKTDCFPRFLESENFIEFLYEKINDNLFTSNHLILLVLRGE